MTVTPPAQRVGLSKKPRQARLRRLIDTGVIRGLHAAVDAAKLGLDHVPFAEVKLSDTREAALAEFNAGCSASARWRMPYDRQQLRSSAQGPHSRHPPHGQVLGEQISSLPHVASTSAFVAMETVKDDCR